MVVVVVVLLVSLSSKVRLLGRVGGGFSFCSSCCFSCSGVLWLLLLLPPQPGNRNVAGG